MDHSLQLGLAIILISTLINPLTGSLLGQERHVGLVARLSIKVKMFTAAMEESYDSFIMKIALLEIAIQELKWAAAMILINNITSNLHLMCHH